jgi:hypothetical protein
MNAAIADARLRNQRVTGAPRRRPADVVAWLGAVQAQEYDPARWALGLRLPQRTVAEDIERAFAAGEILRTHVLRPTWHFVTPADIRWMLELTGPRVGRVVSSYMRRLGLGADVLARAIAVFERALENAQYLTRSELAERLRRAGLTLAGTPLALVTMHAELEGVICSGPRRGKLFTYALVAERVPDVPRLSRDEAVATLSRRYFTSHGPATIRDFVWWSGLTSADAKRGLEMNKARREDVAGLTYWTIRSTPPAEGRDHLAHLIPIYDEYLVSYRDRAAVPHGPSVIAAPKSVIFQHALVIGGGIAGTWRTARNARGLSVRATLLRPLARRENRALADAAERYARFVGVPVEFSTA